jgi:predicted Zn-dependent protease
MPEESAQALEIERTISRVQAEEFSKQGARPLGHSEVIHGLAVQPLIDRLSRVTERPSLRYRAYVYRDDDPNAAALADGRIYLSSGMLAYLGSRGSRPDEFAFILGHELAHTVAQHLVKRYRALQQQELIFAVAAAGAAAITRNASEATSRLALQAVSLAREVVHSNYSQQDELEADQLGIQYAMRAGFNPRAALDLLEDFQRFDVGSPLLRTHPYIATRREYLVRYLAETGRLTDAAPPVMRLRDDGRRGTSDTLKHLRDIQRLYPTGSVSWMNLQRQIDAAEQ